MKKISFIFFLCLIILPGNHLFSIWEQCSNGLYGGWVCSIAFKDSMIFAGTFGGDGFYISKDNGDSWVNKRKGIPSYVQTIAIKEDFIFIGTWTNGVYYSNDNGENWIHSGLDDMSVSSLIIYNDDIFACTDDGLFLSTNNGQTWDSLAFQGTRVCQVEIINNNIIMGAENGLFQSSDFGKNWINLGINSYVTSILITNGFIFVGTLGDGILVSDNNGLSWEKRNNGLNNFGCYTIRESDSLIYAGTSSGIYSSSDDGINWKKLGTINHDILAIALSGNKIFIGSHYSGILLSTDRGENWVPKNEGLKEPYTMILSSANNNLICGTLSGVYYSSDNGDNWFEKNSGLKDIEITSIAISDSNYFVGTYNGIYLSTDNCDSWKKIGLNAFSILSIKLINNKIFVGTRNGIYLSDDFGENWSLLKIAYPDTSVPIINVKNNIIFAGTSLDHTYKIYKSEDLGSSWNLIYSPKEGEEIKSIEFNDSYIFLGTNSNGFYRSSDDGFTWENSNNGMKNNWIHSLLVKNNYIFAATLGYIYLSSNNGDDWKNVNVGIDGGRSLHSLAVNDEYIFGNYFDNVYRAKLSDFGITNVEDYKSFDSFNYFPNPAKRDEIITIKNSTPISKIKIIDILGNERICLTAGYHNEIKIKLNNLEPGLYFILLIDTGNNIISDKLIVE